MIFSLESRLAGLMWLVMASGVAVRAEPATFANRVAPVLEKNCTGCHGEDKQKGGLRLDRLESLMRGGENGPVIKAGDLKGSELYRRITLAADEDDFMPSEGKPPLSPAEVALFQKWIEAGTPALESFEAPALVLAVVVPPAAPDYRSRLAAAVALERTLGVRLVPRSLVPTDGLILRTASAPARCDDAVLAQLTPFADLIVEAELGRTKVTDAGLASLARCENLRMIDLSHTAVTSRGVGALSALVHLETLNLTGTGVDESSLVALKALPALQHLWLFGTAAGSGTDTADGGAR